MCGIAGFVADHPLLGRAELTLMRDSLAHRGPDDSGIEMWNVPGTTCAGTEKAAVGLAHRRLSIIDLSTSGRQPMCNEDGSVWLTYNGEFYNFQDSRGTLVSKGHKFQSHTDSETIIHLYEEAGIDETLKTINGMFAFGLWDSKGKTLFLARDRVGKKPLYYTMLPDGSLLYASEMKALLASGLIDRTRIDVTAMMQFWTYGYTMGERTFYEQIRQVLPGHYATWHAGRLTFTRYWDCKFGLNVFENRGLDDLAEELESLLSDSISLRLISDVPLGLFLSGGVDSSLIAALAAKKAGRDTKSFTIAFSQTEFNEAPSAQAVSRHLGLSNTVLNVNEDMEPYVEKIVRQFDEPFGDSSAIPTYFVSKLARQHVTVALTGDAGDELFAGYDNYVEGLRLWGDRKQRRLFKRNAGVVKRIWDMERRLTPKSRRLAALERVLGPFKRKKVFTDSALAAVEDSLVCFDRERWEGEVSDADLLSRMQFVNLKTYLPDDILVKVDRMSMAHALECRSPFLDHRVVEFAARLPYSAKIDEQGRRKLILRRILEKYLPREMMERPKQGFTVPWSHWCSGKLADGLRERWLSFQSPFFRNDAAGLLFPAGISGDARLKWFAFCTLLFLDRTA
jgi:asparagine synthase (glutamine-hydrolysing)